MKFLIVAIGIVPALRAWGNTPIIVTLQKSLDINWGDTTREEFSAGDTLIVVRNYPWYHWYPWGPLSARKWVSGSGYLYIYVPLSDLRDF